jgi:DNA uptake protein ComE-like DNA-binding protein
VDAQGLRHRAAGETELRQTVTEGVPVPGKGVGFAEGQDDAAETFGDDNLSLAQLNGLDDDQLREKPGIGEATVKKIHAARRKAERSK